MLASLSCRILPCLCSAVLPVHYRSSQGYLTLADLYLFFMANLPASFLASRICS
jgi:hypothetical protein